MGSSKKFILSNYEFKEGVKVGKLRVFAEVFRSMAFALLIGSIMKLIISLIKNHWEVDSFINFFVLVAIFSFIGFGIYYTCICYRWNKIVG